MLGLKTMGSALKAASGVVEKGATEASTRLAGKSFTGAKTLSRMSGYAGRHPKQAMLGGAAIVGGTAGRIHRGSPSSTARAQNSGYNQRMRAGQSSAVGGLMPKSMGGYTL
jgi:hypothetical protein